MSPHRTIWLVGMMGAGKSAVGAALAERLGCEFVDSDERIEAVARASIAEIFARHGEETFRRMEREAIEDLAGKPLVAALGGGAMAQPGMAERLCASGSVVWLRALPETVLARIGDAEERPLLAGLDAAGRRERLAEIARAREPHYARAQHAVDTDGLTVDEVAEQIAAALGEGS